MYFGLQIQMVVFDVVERFLTELSFFYTKIAKSISDYDNHSCFQLAFCDSHDKLFSRYQGGAWWLTSVNIWKYKAEMFTC